MNRTPTEIKDQSSRPRAEVDVDVLRQFVTLARPDGGQLMLLRIAAAAGSKPRARTFAVPAETDALIEYARTHNTAASNIYWLPNDATCFERKPAKADMASARFAWSDCDPDIKGFGSYDAARGHLLGPHADRLRKHASFIIDSGNGLQAFFRLAAPTPLTDEWATNYEQINAAIGKEFDGPDTHNCDRIMRVPGTWNWPTESKLRKGYPTAPSASRILYATDRTYTLPDLAALAHIQTDDISAKHMRGRALPSTAPRIDEIRALLGMIPADGSYAEWRDVQFGVHHETRGSAEGMDICDEWSATAEYAYGGRAAVEKVWNSASTERSDAATIGTLHTLAKRYSPAAYDEWEREQIEGDFTAMPAELAQQEPYRPPFKYDKAGAILATIGNTQLALRAPHVAGADIRFDTFRDELTWSDPDAPMWRPFVDEDYTRLRIRLEQGGFKPIGREMIRDAVHLVARERKFDSAIDWLNGLSWDGAPRVDRFMEVYFSVPDSPYARAVSLYLWTAFAGRVLEPGVKADMVPIFIGDQGLRKSSAIAAMVPHADQYVEIDLGTRDAETARKMRGALVGEIAELKGMRTREIESIKAFITATQDTYRQLYKEHATTVPRRLVFIGTSNEEGILIDETGNRRWLPIRVGNVDIDAVMRDRDQLWAEGRTLFMNGGIRWQAAERLAKDEHAAFAAAPANDDPWLPMVEQWLNGAAATRFDDEPAPGEREYLLICDVAAEALRLDASRLNRATDMRIGKILRQLGYEKRDKRIGARVRKAWFPDLD